MTFLHQTALLNPTHIISDAEDKLGEDAQYHVQFEFNLLGAPDDHSPELSDGDLQTLVELYADGMTSGEMEYIHYDDNDNEQSYRLIWQLKD